MRIQKVMQETGLSKKAIHYYIKQAMLFPKAEENGYYNFSKEDVDRLKFIQFLRSIDLSIREIRAVLDDPETAVFFFSRHKKRLYKEKALLEWQYHQTEEVEKYLNEHMSFSGIIERYKDINSRFLLSKDVKPIDDLDAETIAYHFFGNFMQGLEMTEYRLFLYGRIKHYLIANQTEQMIALRDYLDALESEQIKKRFRETRGRRYEELIALEPEEHMAYTRKMITVIKKNLRNPKWVLEWKKHYNIYIEPATIYYDGEISNILCELSPIYKKHKVNTAGCSEIIYQYLKSEEGESLKKMILTELNGYINLEDNHHTDLIGLYIFEMN